MAATTGSTRFIQGVCQGVSSAKRFCMSTQRWTVRSVNAPRGRRSAGIAGSLQPERIGVRHAGRWRLAEGRDRTRHLEPQKTVELLRQAGFEIVAQHLRLGPVNDADRP